MADDHYEVLGVARDATTQDIKRAFREIARKCHPDVAGDDREAEERFKEARLAYETLMDPVTRARYDRRAQRKAQGGGGAPPPGGSFFDAFWQASERAAQARGEQAKSVGARTGKKNPGNQVGLDDLFDDFGDFGFASGQQGSSKAKVESPGGGAGRGRPVPQQGEDVHVDLEVPADLAKTGGSVTAVYYRMQRADSWRPGAPDPGLVRIQDIADIRIIPGTREGSVLRERGLGNSGSHGGPYGDLICTVRIVGARATPPPTDRVATPPPVQGDATLDITVVEALLGGRVAVDTPQGRIRATIPPCTSSGVRLRLKGKGRVQTDGSIGDWYVVTRIVVPARLDDASRALIEEFARLNPVDGE